METERPPAELSPPKGPAPLVEEVDRRRPPTRLSNCRCSCGGNLDECSVCDRCHYDFSLGAFFT